MEKGKMMNLWSINEQTSHWHFNPETSKYTTDTKDILISWWGCNSPRKAALFVKYDTLGNYLYVGSINHLAPDVNIRAAKTIKTKIGAIIRAKAELELSTDLLDKALQALQSV